MATTYNITTDFVDPEGNDVSTGTLVFKVDDNTSETLKHLEVTVTPGIGTSINLVEATYDVYYISAVGLKTYLGEIIVSAAGSLTTLLSS